ncbi:MAG: carbon-nitrogen hydrolase family protein [Phycisphaerales bacterium]|nr:carbon-nitrogen hydrolase family protein [Phycisphaerales bacterium]
MRVAAVQIEVDTASRTETLQRALSAIDAAAEMDPAPDLVVLPAFLDTCGDGPQSKLEYVYGPGTSACGFRARSWGVFVAMGLAERSLPLPRLKSVLYDRDGDHRLIQSMSRPGDALRKWYQSEGKPLGVARVLVGRIALLTDDDIVSEDAWREVVQQGAQLIVGTIGGGATTAKSLETALKKYTKQFGRPCVVADLTTGRQKIALPRTGVSRIVDADGEILAAATSGVADIITADLSLPVDDTSDGALTASGVGE